MAYLGITPSSRTVRTETVKTAANNQTVFYPNGGYQKGYIDVFVNGVKKSQPTDYTAYTGTSVTFGSAVANGDVVSMIAYGPLSMYNVFQKSGDSISGDLTVQNVWITANTSANKATYERLVVNTNTSVNGAMSIVGSMTQSGNFSITGNIELQGSLLITGAATSVTTQSLSVEDTIISLGSNNSSDTLDIGFAGQYSNGTSNVFAGFVRDAGEKKFYAFKDYSPSPNNNIDILDASFATATIVADFEGDLTSNVVTTSTLNSGNGNFTSSIHLTGDASGYKQDTTTVYGGNAGTGEGRIEYYSDAWVFNAGSDSANLAIFQRGNTIKAWIDNDGNFSGGVSGAASSVNTAVFVANSTIVKVLANDKLTFNDGTTQNTAFRVYDSSGTRIA